MRHTLNLLSILPCFFLMSWGTSTLSAQPYTLANPFVVNSFPQTLSSVNTSDGETASGMQGSCPALPCCSVYVAKVEVALHGSLRLSMSSYTPLATSMIAYSSVSANPSSYSELSYLSSPSPGNFCGFRDTLQLGMGYSWVAGNWNPSTSMGNPTSVLAPGTYFVLIFTENQQANLTSTPDPDITFDFVPFCPQGFSCETVSAVECGGAGYLSPAGKVYLSPGSYQDTLIGAAAGGLDSLIFLNLEFNQTTLTQDFFPDDTLCFGVDTLRETAYTESVSYLDFQAADQDWVAIDSLAASLINTNRSVFAWIKKSAQVSGSSQVIVGINTAAGGNISNLQIGTNENLALFDGTTTQSTSANVTDGQWHLVGYTYDESTHETKLYVDGEMELSFSDAQSIGTANDQISLGQEFDSGTTSNFYEGWMTEVSFWDEVLDSTEIALLMKQTINSSHPQYAHLKAYYPMVLTCEADPAILIDQSPMGLDGQASANDIQIVDQFGQIAGFNAAGHYEKSWRLNGSEFATTDEIVLATYSAGTYQLALERAYLTLTEDWGLTLDPSCPQCPATIDSISVTTCDSYLLPSGQQTLTQSGIYEDTLVSAAGCDSILLISLTLNSSSNSLTTISTCDSYAWTDGNTYTQSGTYSQTLTNAAGCDSIATLSLSLNNSSSSNMTISACDSYSWTDGNTYTQSGNYAQTLTNSVGCDSLVTLNLTINNSSSSSTTIAACDSFVWTDGLTYTNSGTYTQTLVNGTGCDSVAALLLTIEASSESLTTVSTCEPYVWTDSITYTQSGIYTQTLVNAIGCDSVATLQLSVNTSDSTLTFKTSCESYVWTDGMTYTQSGTYTQSLTNAAGCDSVVTLQLTIQNLSASVSVSGQTLIATSKNAVYQWLDCNADYAIIPGATGDAYTPGQNGTYAVEIRRNNCVDTSACTAISLVSLEEPQFNTPVQIYPNPSTGVFTLALGATYQEITIRIRNVVGQEVQHVYYPVGEQFQVNLSDQPAGIYLLELTLEGQVSSSYKLLKN